MANLKIPFDVLTKGSDLVLTGLNTNTKCYDANGAVIEGKTGDPKIEVCALDLLEKFSITIKALDPALASITEKDIASALKSRSYILVELANSSATPYSSRSGHGINFSVRADAAKIIAPQISGGFGKSQKTTQN